MNNEDIRQINKPISRDWTVLSRFRRIGEEKESFLILSRDPVELLLVTNSENGHKKYNLLTASDRALLYEGELGVSNAEWSEDEGKLTFYKYYIVHDDLRKVAVCFNDAGPIHFLESKADTDAPCLKSRNYHYL